VIVYYHDIDVCSEINNEHLNLRHLTEDLARRLGGMDKVPRLSQKVYATNNLEQVIEDNEFIFRYGRFFYELFTGNALETHLKVLQKIDGKPEGPNTILNVHKFLEKRNMYSPIFHYAYKIFNEERSREEIREQVLHATQFDRRAREYIGPVSRLLYRLFPNLWYRRQRGLLANP